MNLAAETWKNIIEGATKEEKKFITKMLPTSILENELKIRRESITKVLGRVVKIMDEKYKEDMSILEMKDLANELKEALNHSKPKHKKNNKVKNIIEDLNNKVENVVKTEEVEDGSENMA